MNHKPRTALSWVEISRSALRHNIRHFRKLIGPRRKLMAVVKANAYGHGISEVSRLSLESGADWLGVNSLEEGLLLRRLGIAAPVLILGYVPLEGLEDAVAGDLRLVVYNAETVDRLADVVRRIGKDARLHIKLETGTNRQGVTDPKTPGPGRRRVDLPFREHRGHDELRVSAAPARHL
jgi:alanine racemase